MESNHSDAADEVTEKLTDLKVDGGNPSANGDKVDGTKLESEGSEKADAST